MTIDDLGCRDLGCDGSTFHETPHLDALARSGVRATNGYASSPVCTPTRASLMTGRSPARLAMTQIIPAHREGRLKNVSFHHHLPHSEQCIAGVLQEAGYQTWHIGKWHLGGEEHDPVSHGFETNIAGCAWGAPQHGFFSPWQMPNLPETSEAGTHLTDRLTDDAVDLIAKRDVNREFFLNFSHYSVHEPIQAPERLVQYYREKAARWNLDQIDPIVETGETVRWNDPQKRTIKRRQVQSMPEYAAMVHHLDENVGKLIAALKAEGVWENTLFIFTSDNGGVATHSQELPFTCNHPWSEGKGWCEEGGMRVSYLFHWPGKIPQGCQLHDPIISMDCFPTILHAAGLDQRPELHCDGIDLLPALCDNQPLTRDHLCFHYPHYSRQGGCPTSSIVRGHWKLLWDYETGAHKLYNLANDPAEIYDCKENHTTIAQELFSLLRDWQIECEAGLPEANPEHPERSQVPPIL